MSSQPLQLVDFITSNGKLSSGLVPRRCAAEMNLSIHERAAVFDALPFKHIDFIFFRRFSDGRSSQCSAYVIDNSDQRLDEKMLAKLHRNLWLRGTVPLLYVAWPGRIDVLTCARGPDFWEFKNEVCHYNPVQKFEAESILTAGEIKKELEKFSALRLADGTFWEEPSNGKLADHAKAAHKSLIQAVVEADSELDGKNNTIMRHLLLLMVLIKYLEDRRVFPIEGWFGRFRKGAKNFFEVLQGGNPQEVYRLLDFLERKFDGDVFSLPRGGRKELTKDILNRFADLVEARTLNRQRYLWEQFSFEHLPVEIISHLYHRFVQGNHGTVYTPPFLASLLLDHAMPYERLSGKERILDPACGSGIFLVGAFRRLINVWRSHNGWERPKVEILKKILKESIYGIELEANAVNLTAFSLSLCICDALQPDVIWQSLRFDRLRTTNLFEADFFQILCDCRQHTPTFLREGFDIIIGNPPFESKLSPAGKDTNRTAQRQDRSRGALPDSQTAYLFLEQLLPVLRDNGRICLIQPSGLIYNPKAQRFRTNIHRKHSVETILDFSSIRKLYDGADPKTIAVLAQKKAAQVGHFVNHSTFRRTVSVHERICFELDYYDNHRVSQKQAETDFFIWRANLLGGGRLLGISKRLRHMRTLAQYVKQQEEWDYGEGFIAAKTGPRTAAPFLTGKPLLPTNAFTDSGIDESRIKTVKETHFRSAYTENRFSAPLILIKEVDSLPIEFWKKGFLAYTNKIIGIHAPKSQESKLARLYMKLRENHNIYRFACLLNGTQPSVVLQ